MTSPPASRTWCEHNPPCSKIATRLDWDYYGEGREFRCDAHSVSGRSDTLPYANALRELSK